MFETAILNNPALSKVQMFAYLMSSLQGEAKACLAGLTLTEQNFLLALEILTTRFGQKDAIIREHLKSLQKSKPPNATAVSLRQFSNEILMHKRCLENLEVGVEKYETMMMPILLQKLPESIRKKVVSGSLRSSNCYTMDKFLALLNHEIDVLEECKEIGAIDRSSQSDDAKREVVTFREGSATVLHTLTSKPTTKKTRTSNKFCVYCDSQQHYSSDCTVVKCSFSC